MASIGHIAVGMAAARMHDDGPVSRLRSMAFWSAISLLPDADVIGFSFGVRYEDPWGHRGATHSLAFSVAAGLVIGMAARRFGRPAARTALFASLVLVSHALLDTMTDGGLGCALFWPFDPTRYFAPWRPILVAPIGLDFFSPYGAVIALSEAVLFSPLLVLGLRGSLTGMKRTTMWALLTAWLAASWLLVSGDPVRESVLGYVLREDTAYAVGFSEEAFRSITPGTPEEDVQRLLGAPVRESWYYPPKGGTFESAAEMSAAAFAAECLAVSFEHGVVTATLHHDACTKAGIGTGTWRGEVARVLGAPPESCRAYTWSPRNRRYRLRMVCFSHSKVEEVIRRWQ